MAAQKLQVLSIGVREGVSKKGNPYRMEIAQCVLHSGDEPPVVGELILPKEHAVKPGGYYTVTCSLVRGMDGKIQGQVETMAATSAPAPSRVPA